MPRNHAIMNLVCETYCVTPDQINQRSRIANHVLPRQVFCYLARQLTGASITQIGNFIGGRDHTTVMKAINRTADKMKNDPYLREQVEELQNILQIAFQPRFYRHTAFDFKTTRKDTPCSAPSPT